MKNKGLIISDIVVALLEFAASIINFCQSNYLYGIENLIFGIFALGLACAFIKFQ